MIREITIKITLGPDKVEVTEERVIEHPGEIPEPPPWPGQEAAEAPLIPPFPPEGPLPAPEPEGEIILPPP